MLKRLFLSAILLAAVTTTVSAAYGLTATSVQITDVSVDKANYMVVVETSLNTSAYTVVFDVWPKQQSAIGTFSASDRTISAASCSVHKTLNSGNPVNLWYYPDESASVSLSIVSNGDSTCTLSGSIQASRAGTQYTYTIAPFDFAYSEAPVDTVPELDPYRFEPTTPTHVDFVADVVNMRYRQDGYISMTLNEMAGETYDWIELNLISDTLAVPAGTYAISNSREPATLTASRGYLGMQNDDPCYLAIRGDREEWGAYTPYYLVSGSMSVSYNDLGDSIFVSGSAVSYYGTTVSFSAASYNMLYVREEEPRQPEKVSLSIDTVQVTYLRTESDHPHGRDIYTLDFFSSHDDFPNVLVDLTTADSMQLTQGTFSLSAGQLSGLRLYQNQADFNEDFFGGVPYVFAEATLTLASLPDGRWSFSMFITDTIGSEYSFTMIQHPHIINYPVDQEEVVDPAEKPYTDELKEVVTAVVYFDSLIWNDRSVTRDGILDITLTQSLPDELGMSAVMQLGFYTPTTLVPAGQYPVSSSEDDFTFSASMGRYGNVLIPCYLALMDGNGWAHRIWYMMGGDILLSYDDQHRPLLSGECTSYYGSTIRFSYEPVSTALDAVSTGVDAPAKFLRDGHLLIQRGSATYDLRGQVIKL